MNKGRISQEQVQKHPERTKDNVGLSLFSSLMGLESPFQRSSTFAWTHDPMIRGMDFVAWNARSNHRFSPNSKPWELPRPCLGLRPKRTSQSTQLLEFA